MDRRGHRPPRRKSPSIAVVEDSGEDDDRTRQRRGEEATGSSRVRREEWAHRRSRSRDKERRRKRDKKKKKHSSSHHHRRRRSSSSSSSSSSGSSHSSDTESDRSSRSNSTDTDSDSRSRSRDRRHHHRRHHRHHHHSEKKDSTPAAPNAVAIQPKRQLRRKTIMELSGNDKRVAAATMIQRCARAFLWRVHMGPRLQEWAMRRRRIAYSILDSLVTQVIVSDILPDLLIDILSGQAAAWGSGKGGGGAGGGVSGAEVAFAEDLLREVVQEQTLWCVRQVCAETARSYLTQQRPRSLDPVVSIAEEDVLGVVIEECARQVVRQAVDEMAQELLMNIWLDGMLHTMIQSTVEEAAIMALEDAQVDAAADECIEETLSEMVSLSIIPSAMSEVTGLVIEGRREEESRVLGTVGQCLADSILFNALLRVVATKAEGVVVRETTEKFAEEVLFQLLLSYQSQLQDRQDEIFTNAAFSYFLDSVAADTLLPFLLGAAGR